jgi:two-component system, NarL family, nitrate/nitrite response regulator NarL
MNVLLVDDHALFREGLRALLANISPGLVIHEASSVEGAVDECRTTDFRMVLLDLGLSDTGGLETLASFRESVPHVPVVVLSGEQQAKHIRAAIDHGAVGFVPKSHTSDLMIAALRLVLSGGVYLPPNALDDDVETATPEASDPALVSGAFARLSPRQRAVADMLLRGSPNKVIARELSLSEGTVKAHVSAIFQILGARNRVEAVIIAAKSGVKVM